MKEVRVRPPQLEFAAIIQLVETLSHCSNEFDLSRNIVKRGVVRNALQQILNNFFVTHAGSFRSCIIFFKANVAERRVSLARRFNAGKDAE